MIANENVRDTPRQSCSLGDVDKITVCDNLENDKEASIDREHIIENGIQKKEVVYDEKKNHIDRGRDNVPFCHICNLVVSRIHDVKEHLRGFRHRKSQAALDSVMKNLSNVRNSTSENEGDYFSTLHDEVEYENISKNDDSTFVCTLCDKRLESFIDAERHLIGKLHVKKLSLKSNPHFPWDKIKELECGKKENIKKLSTNKFRCTLCCKNLDLMSVLSHVGGNTHQLALGLQETKKKDKLDPLTSHDIWNEIFTAEDGKWSNISQISSESFRCYACSQLLSVNDIIPHVKSESHQSLIHSHENVKKNEVLQKYFSDIWESVESPEKTHHIHFKIDSNTSLYCIPCNVILPGTVGNLIDHIHGKSHMGIVMKYLMMSPDIPLMMPEDKVITAQVALVKALMPKEERMALNEFHCIICNVRISLEAEWEEHLNDDRHMGHIDRLLEADMELITDRCSVCDATVFCVKSDVGKHDCQMKLSRHRNYIPSGAVLSCRRNKRDSSKYDCVPRIIISGYSKDVDMDMLYSCFRDFGKITYIAMTRESAIIEFTDKIKVHLEMEEPKLEHAQARSAMEDAISHPPSIGDIGLQVDQLKYYNSIALLSTDTVLKDIVSVLESVENFERKVEELCKLTNTLSSPQTFHNMCHFLETELSSLFPDCKAFPFGSRMSGLAFPESDMDIFLDTGGMYEGRQRQEADVQELIVSVTENALKQLPQCSHVEGVPKARTPIVRFYHNPSKTQCDVAFRNGLGVENTKLIRFYTSLDERVKPLIMFVKYWAETHELVGPCKITNYALTWLVIFYLQQASNFGLPSVENLQRLYEGRVSEISGWKCSFCNDTRAVRTIKCTKSVLQLLHGFFMHYHKFDYSRNVVSPLVGVPVKRSFFIGNIYKLPQCMENYIDSISANKQAEKFRTSACMCVQDPFDLSHNITKGTPQAVLRKFKTLCALSAQICSKINK